MASTTTVAATSDQDTNGLISGIRWNAASLTFSFPSSASFYGSGYGNGEPSNNFHVLNATQQAAVRSILTAYSSVIPVTFVEIGESASVHADLRFAQSDAPSTAWAYYPSPGSYGGDSWYNFSSGYYANPVRGNYAWTTFTHEIGHALGLEHGHEGGDYGPMTYAHDSMEYSIMTYRSYEGASTTTGYTNENWGFAQTLMMYDIAALQAMYGANFNTNNGNTIYAWSPTTGQMSINGVGQGAPGGNRIFATIWDGGGSDTYDFSNYASNLTVSLRPGEWTTTSSTQLARLYYTGAVLADGNIANALTYGGDLRSLIENAFGGSGNDSIVGNVLGNDLRGNGGNDALYGLDGDDSLNGGAGNDTLTGGFGSDSFIFSASGSGSDIIQDFVSGQDHLVLSRSGFGLATTGSLAAAGVGFVEGMTPTGANPTLLYDRGSANVYWDGDGTGAVAPTMLAHVNVQGGGDNDLGPLSGWSHAATGDFNGNGTDDILWQNSSSGANCLWLMANNQLVQPGPLGTVPGWEVLASADLNGDNTDDLIWHNAARGENFVWLMSNGQPSQSFYGGLIPGWDLAASADLNGDGTEDLLWRNASTGENYLWIMGGGQPVSSGSLGVIPGWSLLASGDFNGDNTADLIWNNPSSQTNYLWLMQNGQPFQTFYAGNIPGWNAAAVGDFNDDGTDDILWQNGSTRQVYMWLMSNGQPLASFGISQLDGQQILGAGDNDNDGNADILWQDRATSEMHILDMETFLTPALHASDWTIV